jgi:hypothetical protein
METSSEMTRDLALIRRLAFRQFCEVEWMRWGMMGQGGGQECLIERIGVGVRMIGHGGGRCFAVMPAGVCVP